MASEPITVDVLDRRLKRRAWLLERIAEFDPPEPENTEGVKSPADELGNQTTDVPPAPKPEPVIVRVGVGPNPSYGCDSHILDVNTAEEVRLLVVAHWRSMVTQIDGELANVRGVVP